jgi:preprotein translocase subunit SecE
MKESPSNRRRNRLIRFLGEVRQELSTVTWPTRREVVAYSIVVLVTVTVLGSFIFALDYLFSRLILKLLST